MTKTHSFLISLFFQFLDLLQNIELRHGQGRFSQLVIITDQESFELSTRKKMCQYIAENMKAMDGAMAVSTLQIFKDVDRSAVNTACTQFDFVTQTFVSASRQQFEDQLFHTIHTKCNFRSQPYHQDRNSGMNRLLLYELLREEVYEGYDW